MKGTIYYVPNIAKMIFSHVKITCVDIKFVKAHLVFHWCLYNIMEYQFDLAGLAQSVERLTAEREVTGSIPGAGPLLRVLK